MLTVVLAAVPSTSEAAAPGWTVVNIYNESGSNYVQDNSMAVDSHGHIHIAFGYGSGDIILMYATNASGSWVTTVVDNTASVGYYASIAIDSNDKAHIAYYDYDSRGVKYATNAGGAWVNETVISRIAIEDGNYRADGQNGLTLAIDSSGNPQIVYTNYTYTTNYNYVLSLAVKAGGLWHFENADYGAPGEYLYLHNSLVLDSSDHRHIAYSMGSRLHYATDASGSWAAQPMDEEYDNGWGDTIAMDRQGHLGISYITNQTTPPLNLKYATNASGAWVIETVTTAISRPASLGYNTAGNPCIMTMSDSYMALYTKDSGSWTKINPVGNALSISLLQYMMTDEAGKIHVCYSWYGNLYYATDSIPMDLNPPSITITSPSSSGSYSTTSSTIDISGTASDDVGVTSVTWINDRGGSGPASGTSSWSINDVPLQSGDNVITVTATDGADRETSASITVTYTPDTTDPVVTITSPSSSATYTTYVDHISAGDLAGTASDNIGVTSVTCRNNANGLDVTIAGTTSWSSTADLSLVTGSNEIVITATDAAGNTGTDIITVTYALDTTDPTVTISSPSEGSATNSTTVTVTWTGSDNVGIIGFQYRIDADDWSIVWLEYEHTFTSLSQGAHSVEVRAIDAQGNNATATVHFTVDLASPTMSITSPSEGALVNSPTVSWSGNDALSGIGYYLVRVDSGPWSGQLQTASYTFSGLADGEHEVQIRAYDLAGNYFDQTVTFTLDATAPVLIIDAPSSGSATKVTSVTVEWSATDATSGVAGYQYRIDNGAWSSISSAVSHEFTGLSNGNHNVTVRAVDQANNMAERYVVFVVDTVLPSLTINGPVDGSFLNHSSVQASWTASDSTSGIASVSVRIDGGAWSTVASGSTFGLSGLADGAHTVTIRVVDAAGNAREASSSFTVDTVAPELSITAPAAGAVDNLTSVTVEWSATDATSEVVGYQYKLDGGAWSTISSALSHLFAGLSNGPHNVTVRAIDQADNIAERYVVFIVDNTTPIMTINGPANNTHFSTATVTVNWSATDAYSEIVGYRYRLDGGAWSSLASLTEHTFSGLSQGSHTFEVEATDEANNNATASVTFVVDTTSPVVSITSPTSNATYATNSSTMTLSGSNSDNLGVTEVTWTNSRGGSGTATISGANWSISGIVLQEGSNVITITARDASGNTATTTLTVDYTKASVDKAASPGLDTGMLMIVLVVVVAVVMTALYFVKFRKK